MQIVEVYQKHKKRFWVILQILLFPLIMIGLDVFIRTILNMGVYFGSFIRGVFELVL